MLISRFIYIIFALEPSSSILTTPTTPLLLGQLFHSIDDVKQAREEWSIADKFAFQIHVKDADRYYYRCKFSTRSQARAVENVVICPWRVFASRTRTEESEIGHLS